MAGRDPVMTAAELEVFLDEVFPQMQGVYRIPAVGPMRATLTQEIGEAHLRPGGTVSGPTLFAIADCAFYVAVMAMIGRQALTVTSGLTINFLRKPPVAPLRAEARILKLGRTLAAGDVEIFSEGVDGPVAHAAVTYAIPRA